MPHLSTSSCRILIIVLGLILTSSLLIAQIRKNKLDQSQLKAFDVSQVSSTLWNTRDGILQKQIPGSNLGVASFELLDSTNLAYLSDTVQVRGVLRSSAHVARLASFLKPF